MQAYSTMQLSTIDTKLKDPVKFKTKLIISSIKQEQIIINTENERKLQYKRDTYDKGCITST